MAAFIHLVYFMSGRVSCNLPHSKKYVTVMASRDHDSFRHTPSSSLGNKLSGSLRFAGSFSPGTFGMYCMAGPSNTGMGKRPCVRTIAPKNANVSF